MNRDARRCDARSVMIDARLVFDAVIRRPLSYGTGPKDEPTHVSVRKQCHDRHVRTSQRDEAS